jgi:SAM-dependent methyltransferase
VDKYNGETYWSKRLGARFDLSGVGFRNVSVKYNEWLYKAHGRALEKVLKEYEIDLSSARFADLGCGTGYFIDYFVNRGVKRPAGLDITEIAIGKMEERYPDGEFRVGDLSAENLPLKGPFDVVTCFAVLYHIIDDNSFKRAIENAAGLVAPGGYLLISDYFKRRPAKRTPATHFYSRSADVFREELEKYGLEILEIAPIYFWMNRPLDTANPSAGFLLDALWAATVYIPARFEFLGGVLGRLWYGLDGAVLPIVNRGWSAKLAVCRKKVD